MEYVTVINKTRDCELADVEVATTIFRLVKGLMFRKAGSMLLDFGRECIPGIWMLFMKYPLLLAFVNEEGVVTKVVENASPVSFNPATWKVYRPEKKSRYVLEVDYREIEKRNFEVEVGDVLKFRKTF